MAEAKLALWRIIVGDLRTWAIIGAAIIVTLGATAYTLLVWLPDWPANLAHLRLMFLGWGMVICLSQIAVIIAALTKRRIALHGPGGVSFDTGSDVDPPPIVTTTTTTVTPTTAPATTTTTTPANAATVDPAPKVKDE